MTVYRPKQGEKAVHTRCAVEADCCLSDMVPVKRCEHGNIDPHIVIDPKARGYWFACPGAEIGDNE